MSLRVPITILALLTACSAAVATTTIATTSPGTEGTTTSVVATVAESTTATGEAVPFKKARLRVEINSTDGDAGLQIDLDHEPWKVLTLTAPDGTKILDVVNRGVLEGYGLTELFSESSEPPFTEFPLDEFKKLFPEGEYVFEGETIEGVRMHSSFTLSHAFPAGPEILSPEEDSTVSADGLVVEWSPGDQPEGVELVRYQVLVVNETDDAFEFSATVPADVTGITIPAEFLALAGDYKVEVLAIEASGNQTLTEVPFTVR